MLTESPRIGRSARSDDLCRAALALYHDLLLRSTCMDPDAGVAQDYESGRRSIEARACADPWKVPETGVVKAEVLFGTTRALPDVAVGDWIVKFPKQFLATIDRRATWLGDATVGRRRLDRIAVSLPIDAMHDARP